MIDSDLKSWVLEINEHPSFNIISSCEYLGFNNKTREFSEVDLYVKKLILTDCLKMAFKTRNQEKFNEFDIKFESLERLFPSEHTPFSYVYMSMKSLR